MKIYLVSFTEKGAAFEMKLAQTLKDKRHTVNAYAKYPIAGMKSLERLDIFVSIAFADGDAVFFIGAAGIAVRACAPYITDKASDPAVIVIDEAGRYIIPILSGHIGGANALAAFVAKSLGGEAVITTATDVSGKFAVDTWAAESGCIIADLKDIKYVSAAVLKNEPVGFSSEYVIAGALPEGISDAAGQNTGICVSENMSCRPFTNTLNIAPKIYCVGVGCRRGTAAAKIEKTIADVFVENSLDIRLIKSISSIDLKSDEVGLSELAAKWRVPFITFSTHELQSAKGVFTASEFVASVTGVDNVCERAAVLASDSGELTVQKTARCGVTVAVAKSSFKCRFGGERN